MGLFGEKLPNIPAFMVSGKDRRFPSWEIGRPVDRSSRVPARRGVVRFFGERPGKEARRNVGSAGWRYWGRSTDEVTDIIVCYQVPVSLACSHIWPSLFPCHKTP